MKRHLFTVTVLGCVAFPAMALDCEDGFRPFEHAAGED